MALRNGVGGCLLGRGPPCRRGAILYHMGREKVGCCWLSAITLHSVIMPPLAAASNLNSSLGSLPRAGAENTSEENNPEHDEEARGKSAYSCGLSAGRGVGGLGVSGRAFTARIYSPPRRAARGKLGNLRKPRGAAMPSWIAAKHHIDKFDEMTVMMFLFFQAKER